MTQSQTTFNVMTNYDNFIASYTNEKYANEHAKLVNGYVTVTNMSDVMGAVMKGYRYYRMTFDTDRKELLNMGSDDAGEQFKLYAITSTAVPFTTYWKHNNFYNFGVWAQDEDHSMRLVNEMLYRDGVIDIHGN